MIVRNVALLILFLFALSSAFAQRIIKGEVRSFNTHHTIPRATISLLPQGGGTSSDNAGNFMLRLSDQAEYLQIKSLGYHTELIKLDTLSSDSIIVQLTIANSLLDEVVISKKGKYNKNNPAVELIKQVIAHKKINRVQYQQKIQYEEYEKVQFGFVNPPKRLEKSAGKLDFYFKNLDTVTIKGKSLLPFYMEENISEIYAQNSPSRYKKQILAHQKTEYDERYINNDNIKAFIEAQFQPVDLYDPSIYLLRKLFISPIADHAPQFYEYQILDTLHTEDGDYIELNIQPKNPYDLLFTGTMQISTDGRYAVRQADLVVGERANINFVNDIILSLQYEPDSSGFMLLTRSNFGVVFGGGKTDSFYGRKLQIYDNYRTDIAFPDDIFKGAPVEKKYQKDLSDSYWTSNRREPLNVFEENAYNNVDSLNNMKSFKTLLAVGYLIAKSYYNAGPVEFGPLEYSYSFNNIEGNRFRFGGRTTRAMSEYMFFEGYMAYGDRDQQLKYFMSGAFSLNGQVISAYPAHYAKFTVQHDVMEPGRGVSYLKGDGFFQSFRSNRPVKWMYNTAYMAEHLYEFGNHVSILSSFTHHRRETAGQLRFVDGYGQELNQHINTNDLSFELRWAPKEEFYFRNLDRQTIINKYPIFKLKYSHGFKGFWGAEYSYNKVQADIFKRLFLAQFGLADVKINAGHIFGSLPYPLLEMPNIRTDNTVHSINYSKMNSMEFVADRYIKFAFDHELNGYLFNKLPLIRKLKWRELWGFYMFYGNLSSRNNPLIQMHQIQFDPDDQGFEKTRLLKNDPYMEGYVGIDNIFKIFRVEYVKRLSYLNFNQIPKDSFRFSVHLNF